MSVCTIEVFPELILCLILIKVSFKQCKSEQVGVDKVIKDCIAKNFKLFIIEPDFKLSIS